MSNKGFQAFDITIGQKVLVMSSVLCFLADSPMHTKIINTPVPGNSLNPCRICHLWSSTMKDQKKLVYISQYLQKNLNGSNVMSIFGTLFES
jgi:hypothetical protein